MAEFPDPDRSEEEKYIELLQDRIEFLEEELTESEKEKLELKQELNEQPEGVPLLDDLDEKFRRFKDRADELDERHRNALDRLGYDTDDN